MRGLRRAQIGVTEAQIDAFGDLVFGLSHNHQVRRGDPIRTRDFAAIEAQRAALGLADAEIALRVGLTVGQVTYIRNVVERRRFRRNRYHRLIQLGGGRRYRAGRNVDPSDTPSYDENAMRIRNAMSYPPDRARHYVDQGWWRGDTLDEWLARHAAERPDAPAIVGAGGRVSYAELAGRVRARAAGFAALGVARGDVVTVQLPNGPEFIETYLAVTRLGAIMSTLYLPHRAAEMAAMLGFARSKVVVAPSAIGDFPAVQTLLGLRASLPALEQVVAVGAPVDGAVAYADVSGDAHDIATVPGPVGSDPFLLLFTSGTTSAPKAVPLSYQNMLSNARLSVPEHGLSADDVVMSAAPFGHLYALYSFHLALAVGAATAVLPVFSPPALGEALDDLAPNCLFAAPAHIAAGLGTGALDEARCAALKLVVMSGSAVSPAVATRLAQRMPHGSVSQLWGMTETQAGLYTRPDDDVEVVARSAGRPSPGTEVRIVGEDGAEVAAGEEGELQVRGALLFPGYLDNEAANVAAFTADGWFRSGDIARRDAMGNVSITGRTKDVINRGGVKYNPRDVEELLDAHPDIAQSAIVPMRDDLLGERACCFAVPAGEVRPSLEMLAEYLLAQGIAKVKLPERLEWIDAMPLTPTRKVIKGKLPVPGAGGDPHPPA